MHIDSYLCDHADYEFEIIFFIKLQKTLFSSIILNNRFTVIQNFKANKI